MAKQSSHQNQIENFWSRAVGVLVVLATLWYLPWALANLNLQALWLSIPFAAASVMTALTTIITAINHWHHSVPEEHVIQSGSEPTVAVIIPTLGEPPQMVFETAMSVLEQDYPLDRITLIISDDSHREGTRLAVERLRGEWPGAAIFYHEPPRRGDPRRRGEAKAGNLNSVLDALQTYAPGAEYVETRDADDTVGDGAFLRKTVGQLLADPRTAFVQTIKEAVTSPSDPFGNLEPLFYRRAMLARHAANAVFPCGSGLVWRMAALTDIGGFPSWNLVEDLQSGVEALRRGWRGVYLPIVGAVAQAAPEDMPNTIKQRGTWALDTLRLLFWGEKRGLSLAQRLQFVELGMFYLVSYAALIFALTPVFPLLFGIYPLTTDQAQYALHFWPYAAAIEALLTSLAWGLPYEALWRSRQMWLGMAPVYMRATILALRFGPKHKPAYRVTRKDRVYAWYWRLIMPQLALLVLLLAAAAYHIAAHPLLSAADLGSLFWAGFFAVEMSQIVRNSWHGIGVRQSLTARWRVPPATVRQQALRSGRAAMENQPLSGEAGSLAISSDLPVLLATPAQTESNRPAEHATYDTGEPQPRHSRRAYWWLAAVAVVIALLALSTRWAYSQGWRLVSRTKQQQELERTQLYSQAGWDFAAGDYAAAEQKLSALLVANPSDEAIQRHLAEVRRKVALSAGYARVQQVIAQAQQAIAGEDWGQADSLLAELMRLEPDNDAVLALRALQRAFQARSDLFQQGEKAYRAGEWAEANVAYKVLHGWEPEYQEQTVVAHLAESYVSEGILLIQSSQGDTGAVQQAIESYQQALLLQPEQERARRELALAEKYLEGREALARNDLQGALRAWQWVNEQDPHYAANGVAVFLEFFRARMAPVGSGAGSGTEQ